jgi:hypothetical protein
MGVASVIVKPCPPKIKKTLPKFISSAVHALQKWVTTY